MKRLQAIGAMLGIALFVLVGLFILTGVDRPAPEQPAPPAPSAAIIAPAEALGRAYAAVAAHVGPAVVSVYSEKIIKYRQEEWPFPFGNDLFQQFFGRSEQQPQYREYRVPEEGLGSGSILDKQGHVLTNYHVVRNVQEIKVILPDKRTFDAEIVGADPKTDVAIIRMKGSIPKGLPTVQLGDSSALQVGDLVVAIGAPFGYVQTVTTGIISAKGRSNIGLADYEDFLQTDAPINPGNSGGPLVNMRGEVVGMNTAIATSVGQFSGVGFSIPVNMIKSVLPILMKGETVTRGFLGVGIQQITEKLAQHFHLSQASGALVTQVAADSPAAQAGLKIGDIIVRFDDKDVADPTALRNLVAATEPGTKVQVGIIRDGQSETLSVTVGKLEAQKKQAPAQQAPTEGGLLGKFGLAVEPLTPDLARQYNYQNEQGVIVAAVEPGSAADLAGVQVGDLISEVNRQPVTDLDDLRKVLTQSSNPDSVLLLVNHQGSNVYLVLQVQ
jgi:serine protease Do